MAEDIMVYTITTKNPESYNSITTNLQSPQGRYCKLTLNTMTTKACFALLTPEDFIVVNGKKYSFEDTYSDIPPTGFVDLFNTLSTGVTCAATRAGFIMFGCPTEFTINDMSYNTKLISGFYYQQFPITGKGVIQGMSIPLTLSTPILYIVSNLGSKCYSNVDRNYYDQKILMRINNTFSAGLPIVHSNAEFSTLVNSNTLASITLTLVDANFVPVKLLCPMYLSMTAESFELEDATGESIVLQEQLQQQIAQEQQMQQMEQQSQE
ncbi:hypothetical protein TVAGG3_0222760 [Trichomonas vaginalis G3]|uniref:uncharacterized protein n=2 Tax=Trichomonas vaginalis (strain ATCC PRA-98 / G3) TaxID=412133 RepID=UPI0021567752|nr:hypothetical protein TVAGG3_0925000 [Trichomonas vaginalis G3]XP_051078288.1 hypothetical protein TVAGG3_0934150 [Trichomonas vaginalis G3]XP_051083446.1 hypothetical protein TVAGG3_0819600 [Trichomonas vaginalis G3]XP_051083525.1 hypothetical protein TVAGG3_0821580 [Trichomonas vaginalis G3]XP_051083716.1 hypothetical protein TVAGG3_0825310 [Trichomonas vaginalis G3]XP_051084596.1 hypothetical protein TVAGG3_0847720 [Trichomonas vaginalis G3]XP_051084790.1 hypothetical protein TVAGG3_0853